MNNYCPEGEERASLHGPSLILKPKSAQAAAIALHELTTNAVKYGALSVRSGQVQVEWSHRADGKLAISWTESGGPPVSPPSHRGFGSRVIQQIIEGELNGTVSYDWRKAGLVCELAIDPAVEA